MEESSSLVRSISDTALWAALHRARETDREDALFRDPLARRLAGPRGEEIAASLAFPKEDAWTWAARTYLFDRFIDESVRAGADMVVNLAAGLDARPYRMPLPSSLRWVEIDMPDLIAYKENIIGGEKPACLLERIRLDLSDVAARRRLFRQLGAGAKNALILSEGFVAYLDRDEAAALARDLAEQDGFRRWVLDLMSPGLVRMLRKKTDAHLERAGAPIKFGPEEGPGFFSPHGWKPADARSLLKTAARLKRLSWGMRLLSLLPESKGVQGSRPWAAVCLLDKR